LGGKPAVTYIVEGEYQNKHVKSQNVNIYLSQGGKCVDIHISRYPYVEGADTELANIASSAAIEPLK
jgi:hypothetical protein